MGVLQKLMQKWGRITAIGVFLIFAFLCGNFTGISHQAQTKVLGASIHITPTPTSTAVPTTAPITIINNIVLPTIVPTISVTPTPTPSISLTSTLTPTAMPTATPTMAPTTIVTPMPTPTPTPVPQMVGITIDYAGEHQTSTYSATITPNETAWQAVQDALGIANIQYKDYGGSLGIMITGFNGIDAAANQYYDFQVNGTSSNVGVSSYMVQNHDMLKFVLTGF